jgi:hypothetical protein
MVALHSDAPEIRCASTHRDHSVRGIVITGSSRIDDDKPWRTARAEIHHRCRIASVWRDRVVAEGYAQAAYVLIVNQLVRRVHLDPFEDRLNDGESNIIWRRSRNQPRAA